MVHCRQQRDQAGGGDGDQAIDAGGPGDRHHGAGADVHQLATPFPLTIPAPPHLQRR